MDGTKRLTLLRIRAQGNNYKTCMEASGPEIFSSEF